MTTKPNHYTLLVVEDNDIDRVLIQRLLKQDTASEYTFLESELGEDGLLKQQQTPVDCILVDYQLPDMSGLEFLETMMQIDGRTPIIMLTGQGNERVAVNAMRAGAYDYLVKGDLTPENLTITIHNAIRYKRVEGALENSEARFRACVDNLLDCLAIYTAERDVTGRITDFCIDYVNNAACHSSDGLRDATIGDKVFEIFTDEQSMSLFEAYREVVETGEPFLRELIWQKDVGGIQTLVRATDIRAVKFNDGVVVVWRDVTERKRVEFQLDQLLTSERKARQAAEEADQMKLRFLGMITHELKTPLTSIKGFATTLLATDIEVPQEMQHQFIDIISEEADKLQRLIDELLDVAQLQSGRLKIQRIFGAVHESVDIASAQLTALTPRHFLIVDVPPSLPTLMIDRERIAQVLVNLVGNAVKYSPAGSPITVEARQQQEDLLIRVQDQGQGIPPEDRGRIFEPFRQASNRSQGQQGTGLGLAICKGIIEAHGGRIWVEDQLASGTTIAFTLPLRDGI